MITNSPFSSHVALYIAHLSLFFVTLQYNVISVNSTFVLMLFVIDVPTLNKVLSYIILR